MSVVLGIKKDDCVYMGCDSQVTYGGKKRVLTNKNNYKIFKPCENLLVGVVGNLKDANILYTMDKWLEEVDVLKEEINFKYIVRKLVPKIFKELDDFNAIPKREDEFKYIESIILIGYKNNLYKISRDGCVIEIDDYIAVGSGEEFALGGICEDEKDVNKQIVRAISSSCKHDLFVAYPIIIMNTKDGNVDIINK